MGKRNKHFSHNQKLVIAWAMILSGIIIGPLPFVPAIGLIIGGTTVYVSTKPEGWRFPDYIDKKIPLRLKKILYADLRTGKPHPKAVKRWQRFKKNKKPTT